MNILVTGGAGYIGSHTIRKLLEKNHKITILDDLCRGHVESIPSGVVLINQNLHDLQGVKNVFKSHNFDAVIHFAAFMYVWESIDDPILYYQNNTAGTINLLTAMVQSKIKYLVFSSTCSVYGEPDDFPISESSRLEPINPYGYSKLFIEQVLSDLAKAYDFRYVSLRYFNAAGDDPEGIIGESHNPEPHLIPQVLYTALGKNKVFTIFGDDYPTNDGTCIRDYIHVYDLAHGHIKALEYLFEGGKSDVFNLGTGKGSSVKEILDSAEKIIGNKIPTSVAPRRVGDPAILVADNKKAKAILRWEPMYGIDDIIKSAWQWHKNPKY